jgi:hypothetical protein
MVSPPAKDTATKDPCHDDGDGVAAETPQDEPRQDQGSWDHGAEHLVPQRTQPGGVKFLMG